MLGSVQCGLCEFWVWFCLLVILFSLCLLGIRFESLFEAIQFGSWFTFKFGLGFVWVENCFNISVKKYGYIMGRYST